MKILILGHGQLARMMALEGQARAWDVVASDPKGQHVFDPIRKCLIEKDFDTHLAEADLVTAEFEHLDPQLVDKANATGKLFPNAESFLAAGHRLKERELLQRAKVPMAQFRIIRDRNSYDKAIDELELPLVLKTVSNGYDGKGQFRVMDSSDIENTWEAAAPGLLDCGALLAEQWVPFVRELSIVGARCRQGNIKTYDLVHNQHRDGILHLSETIEQKDSFAEKAQQIFSAIANELNYVGVLAIELFEMKDGRLMVNEIAPRVHNSGHWTQQGSVTSQFDQHLRAAAGLPLGDVDTIQATAMVNILGLDSLPQTVHDIPGLRVHWYGKECRPGRKMGHINVSASERGLLKQKLQRLSLLLPAAHFSALNENYAS
jgi:5-(carboxyamino)imidazole ribonucleotide synthase